MVLVRGNFITYQNYPLRIPLDGLSPEESKTEGLYNFQSRCGRFIQMDDKYSSNRG
jgi:hypothetical protein